MLTNSKSQKYMILEKAEIIFNKSIYILYLYYFLLIIIIGSNPSNDIVSDILMVAILYLIPLTVFIITYLLIMTMVLYRRIRKKVQFTITTIIISVKVVIAIVPTFYFDNNLARILLMIDRFWK